MQTKRKWSVVLLLLLMLGAGNSMAQSGSEKVPVERKGFIVGVGIGGGAMTLNTNDTVTTALSLSLPNIKIGGMVTDRLALMALLPGALYKYNGNSRGFEAIQVAGQFWIKDHWWVLGGAGVTFDAPAFYTVKDPASAEFNFGFPSISVATGYEVWSKGKFALDVQYRFFLGKSNLSGNGVREGFSNMLIVGFNWY